MSYNGFKSWNAWNVSLWLNNDEGLYRMMLGFIRAHGTKRDAAAAMADAMRGEKTPDGAIYNKTSILSAMEGL